MWIIYRLPGLNFIHFCNVHVDSIPDSGKIKTLVINSTFCPYCGEKVPKSVYYLYMKNYWAISFRGDFWRTTDLEMVKERKVYEYP